MRASMMIVALMAMAACMAVSGVEAGTGPSFNASLSAPFASCTVGGIAGSCISVASCQSAAFQTSVPGHCPGAADIQCCIHQAEATPGCGTAAVQRAQTWVNVQLQYCQAAQGGRDYSGACAETCKRAHNRQWDPYRSDCSGMVSFAYGLPAPGRVTKQFAPYTNDISYKLSSASQLAPGDAVNSDPVGHIMIFRAWLNSAKTQASFLEEPGCSPATHWASRKDIGVTINGEGSLTLASGRKFWPIRFFSNKGPC